MDASRFLPRRIGVSVFLRWRRFLAPPSLVGVSEGRVFVFRILQFASWAFALFSDLRRRCSAAALCCSPVCPGRTAWWVDAHGACAAASALRRRSSSWILRLHSCDIRHVFCVFRFGERLPSFRPSVARFSTLPSVQRLISWPCTDCSASLGIIVRGCRQARLLVFARRLRHPSISALSRSEIARFLGLCLRQRRSCFSPSFLTDLLFARRMFSLLSGFHRGVIDYRHR